MKELKCGEFDGSIPTEDLIRAVAQQADKVTIAKVDAITHWWLFETEPFQKLAYFGTPESLAAWRRRMVQ